MTLINGVWYSEPEIRCCINKYEKAKKLLKLASENIAHDCQTCVYGGITEHKECEKCNYKWIYAGEAAKIIGGADNG